MSTSYEDARHARTGWTCHGGSDEARQGQRQARLEEAGGGQERCGDVQRGSGRPGESRDWEVGLGRGSHEQLGEAWGRHEYRETRRG